MELDKIEKLLEKYFEAETTVADEQLLKTYFSQESVPTHLEQYKLLFKGFSDAKKERYTKQVPLNTRFRINYKWISVAAVTVLIFGIYFGNQYREQRQAEYAYQETKKALNLLAENFGKGTEKMVYLGEFETTKQKIYKND